MALTEQVVQVNVLVESPEPRVYMVQYDTGRTVRCIIQDWDIPSGATARVFVKKVSGKVVYTDCTVDRTTNSVIISVTNQMIAEVGADNLAMVEITSGDECVTTFAFFLVVKYKLGDAEESKNEVTWVDELMQEYIDEAAALLKEAGDALDRADELAEEAKSVAEKAVQIAQDAADNANTAAEAATKAAEHGIEDASVGYQAGESGVTPPDEEWRSDIPDVPAGWYLWTRVIISYNDGTDTTFYSVGKEGSVGGISAYYDSDTKTLVIY